MSRPRKRHVLRRPQPDQAATCRVIYRSGLPCLNPAEYRECRGDELIASLCGIHGRVLFPEAAGAIDDGADEAEVRS